MRALKIISLIFLSIFLFIILNIFSIGFAVHRTALNPDFAAAQIEIIELSTMVENIVSQQSDEEINPELAESIISMANSMEPELKTQLNSLVYSSYDYIKGKRDNPEMATLLRGTLLSNDFIETLIDEIDIAVMARNVFEEMLSEASPEYLDFLNRLPAAIEQAIKENENLIKTQLKNAAGEIADYLVGNLDSFNAEIDTSPVMDSLKISLRESFINNPPGRLEGVNNEILNQEFEEFFSHFSEEMPSNIVLDEGTFGDGFSSLISQTIDEVEAVMSEARKAASVFQVLFIITIVCLFLLIGLIILIHRNLAGSTLNLGIVFTLSGLLVKKKKKKGRNVFSSQIAQAGDLPTLIQGWSEQLINSALSPMQGVGIVYLAGGALLLATFFFFRYRGQV